METTTEDQPEKLVAYSRNNFRQASGTRRQPALVGERDIWSYFEPKSQRFSIKEMHQAMMRLTSVIDE